MLSREPRAEPLAVPGLHELPVHIDWVRLASPELGMRIAGTIQAGGPVGLMFHHAVMDEDEMRRMSELLRFLAGHERVRADWMIELARAASGA